MNEKILQIVSNYTKIPVDQINDQTVIDRNVLVNSILVHRMYSAIAKEGTVINDYYKIHTIKDLKGMISGNDLIENTPTEISFLQNSTTVDYSDNNINNIGADIENVSSMPKAEDFRTDEFYKFNFTSREISHCILQPNSYVSFAGLFAAKEALVKADNKYKSIPFNKIEITHNQLGKPVISGFSITISHTQDLAIAVAIKENIEWKNKDVSSPVIINSSKETKLYLLLILAIFLSLTAIVISIIK